MRELELAAEEARGARERAEVVRGGLTEELGEVGTTATLWLLPSTDVFFGET